jgi:hypothetical protein
MIDVTRANLNSDRSFDRSRPVLDVRFGLPAQPIDATLYL